MSYYIVAREEGLTLGNSNIKYQHNERKNLTYLNPDVDLSIENHYFKKPDKSYTALFHEMEEQGLFSTRRLKMKDPHTKIGSEIIVAVAGDYFKTKEQAVEFFKVANQALNEFFTVRLPDGTVINGSDLCMSSVVHCDEKSYGLHYVTATCVARELKKKKTKKEVAAGKAGKSLGWYCQLSHSGFWDSEKSESGKLYYSYSKLNDVVAEAIKNAGYKDVERGKRGSTARHLHPNEFKSLMREMETEAQKTLRLVDAKKIAGKYVLDEKSYENLISFQESLSYQQLAVEKSQDLLDVQQRAIKDERKKVKRREVEVDQKIKENAELAQNYKIVIDEIEEKKTKLNEMRREIDDQRETIDFWEALFKWLIDAVSRLLQWINVLLHSDLIEEERLVLKKQIDDLYDDMCQRIDNMGFIKEEARA